MKALSVGGNRNPLQLTQKKGHAYSEAVGRGVCGVQERVSSQACGEVVLGPGRPEEPQRERLSPSGGGCR